MHTETVEQLESIIAAYYAALGDRDPDEVNPVDLLPEIFKAVPFVDVGDVIAALRWQSEKDLVWQLQRASGLKRKMSHAND